MRINKDTSIPSPTFSNLRNVTFVLNDKHLRILCNKPLRNFPDDKIKNIYDQIYETESLFLTSSLPFTFIQKLFYIDDYGFISEDEIQIENITEDYIKSLNTTYKLFSIINKNQELNTESFNIEAFNKECISNTESTTNKEIPLPFDTHDYYGYLNQNNKNLYIDDTINEPFLDSFFPDLDITIEYNKDNFPIFIKKEKLIKNYHYLYSFKNNKFFEINFEYDIKLPEFDYFKLETNLDLTFINSKVNKDNYKIIINEYLNTELFKDSIKEYISSKYSFSKEEKDRKKISELQNEIINQKYPKIKDKTLFDSFVKNNLSDILKDFGLTKKRYSDGFYWYGLVVITKSNPLLEQSN
jgi:hypothetical protein